MAMIRMQQLSPFRLCKPLLLFILLVLVINTTINRIGHVAAEEVRVEILQPGQGPPVMKTYKYRSMVTLYIEEAGGSRTPSGWSTRKENGADQDKPFEFQPGVNLIAGWTQGVLMMKEGERALLHVPAKLGYGDRPMGQPGGAFYIPANSNLLFDIEILGKVGGTEL
jgi:FKBP-type peptidyl-prolyl cis-trans isomerase